MGWSVEPTLNSEDSTLHDLDNFGGRRRGLVDEVVPHVVRDHSATFIARRSLREAHPLARKPTVRAQIATAIQNIDDAIDRIERRTSAKPAARALFELELEEVRIRRRPLVRRKP